jgi:hypothetical protein
MYGFQQQGAVELSITNLLEPVLAVSPRDRHVPRKSWAFAAPCEVSSTFFVHPQLDMEWTVDCESQGA